MKNQRKNTAILFFSNSAKIEIRRKQFSGSAKEKENERLANLLINHNLEVCNKSGLPIEFINSPRQRGNDFGERLKNAFKDVFSKGFTNVVAIGSDCLELSARDLQQAVEAVERNNVALGPCKDGGIYLLGLSELQFNSFNFNDIGWRTSNVFYQLSNVLGRSWNCKIFSPKRDIDNAKDLLEIISSCRRQFRLFAELIFSYTIPFLVQINFFKSCFNRYFLLRGPPIIVQA